MEKQVGGVKEGVELDEHSTKVLELVRTHEEKVANAELQRVDCQVVSGHMYYFHFKIEGETKTITAWDRPWMGSFLEITKLNG